MSVTAIREMEWERRMKGLGQSAFARREAKAIEDRNFVNSKTGQTLLSPLRHSGWRNV